MPCSQMKILSDFDMLIRSTETLMEVQKKKNISVKYPSCLLLQYSDNKMAIFSNGASEIDLVLERPDLQYFNVISVFWFVFSAFMLEQYVKCSKILALVCQKYQGNLSLGMFTQPNVKFPKIGGTFSMCCKSPKVRIKYICCQEMFSKGFERTKNSADPYQTFPSETI